MASLAPNVESDRRGCQGARLTDVHQAATEMRRRVGVITHRRLGWFAIGSHQELSRQIAGERRWSLEQIARLWERMTPSERAYWFAPLRELESPRRRTGPVLVESAEAGDAFARFSGTVQRAASDGRIDDSEVSEIERERAAVLREADDVVVAARAEVQP